ncbi:MAG: tRNA lysidine(34) synthetase TilS [Terriglobia bacterium]
MMRSQSKLYNRWEQEVQRAKLFRAGERVGVAVSGGPDSVLLLHFLSRLAQKTGILIAVVHFNHHLRGAESDADDAFVRGKASELNVEFFRGEAAVARIAREKRSNLEATARALRYRFFLSLVNTNRLDKVATAHTADDQAETVLLRLFRGTGARGLGGIHPVLDGKVIRPFLNVARAEIEREIEECGLPFRLDSTNLDLRLTRNRIRREVLPLLRKSYNPAIVQILKGFADRAREDEALLEEQAREEARPWRIREDQEEKIPIRALIGFPPAIAKRILRQMIASVKGDLRGINSLQLDELLQFVRCVQSGGRLSLPGKVEVSRQLEWLVVRPGMRPSRPGEYLFFISPPVEIHISQLHLKLKFQIVENIGRDKSEWKYNENEGVRIDYGKLRGRLVLRNWRAGDDFCLSGRRKPKKLKEIFLERRIPAERRQFWPIVRSGEQTIWVRGFSPPDPLAATPLSERILVIEEEGLTSVPTEIRKHNVEHLI